MILLIIHCIENTSLIYSGYSWFDVLFIIKKLLYLVLLAKIVFLSYGRIKELLGIVIILAVVFVCFMKSGDFLLMELFIVIIAAKDVEINRIINCFLWIKGASIILTLGGWKAGFIPTLYYKNGSGYYNTLGFCHRNVLGANMVILCLLWFFIRYRELKKQDIFLWLVLSFITFRLAYSKGSFIIMILISVSVFAFRSMEDWIMESSFAYKCIIFSFIALIIISVIGTVFFDSGRNFWRELNSIFTLRFSSANYCYSKYGISLFGQKIPFVNSLRAQISGITKLILDNSYARLILYYGLVPGSMFLFIYIKAIRQAYLHRNGAIITCLLIMAVYGLAERYMLDIYYQFPLIIAFQYFYCSEVAVEE